MVLTCLLGITILAAVYAGSARAAEKGVHFDPGSPAGTEYALPLSRARNEAAGKTGVGKNGSVEPAPLFGEGVSGPGTGGTAHAGGEGGAAVTGRGSASGGGPASGGNSDQVARGVGSGDRHGSPTLGDVATVDSGYSTTSGVLLVTAIVAVGLALGLGLRRGLRRGPSW